MIKDMKNGYKKDTWERRVVERKKRKTDRETENQTRRKIIGKVYWIRTIALLKYTTRNFEKWNEISILWRRMFVKQQNQRVRNG